MLDWVDHIENGVLHVGPGDLQDELDRVIDLPLDGQLPLTIIGSTDAGQPEDGHPVLLGTVAHPIVKLGISGKLDVAVSSESTMTVLEICQAVVMLTNCLLNNKDPGVGAEIKLADEIDGRIVKMQKIMIIILL